QLLAQVFERLVDGETGADRGDLEQDPARLAEVDRPEVEAVDDRRRMRAALRDAFVPGLVLFLWRGPGDVVHGPGPGAARLRRRLVVRVPGAAFVTPDLPDGVAVRVEDERLLEEGAARARVGVGAHAVEALEREV